MGFIGGEIGYRVLRRLSPGGKISCCGESPPDVSHKLDVFGDRFWDDIRNQRVVDFGCGYGAEAIEIARRCPKVLAIAGQWVKVR